MSHLPAVVTTRILLADGDLHDERCHTVRIDFSESSPSVVCEGGSCPNRISYFDCEGSSDLRTLHGKLQVGPDSAEVPFDVERRNDRKIYLTTTSHLPGVGTWTANDPGQGDGGDEGLGKHGGERREGAGGHGKPAAQPAGHR